jgi:hypothetical protein
LLSLEWNDDTGDDFDLDFSERRGESTIIWDEVSVEHGVLVGRSRKV